MAEFVQQSIEEMLPELEQMERVELFTQSEVRNILRKRKSYEYKLRRHTKGKEDYLNYIQYEMHVLELVKKRREKTGYTFKFDDIESPIVRRIYNLFKLCCLRFKNDVKLWLSHIEFASHRRDRSAVTRLYTRMLQIHNRNPLLWIKAAKHEIEFNKSMEDARNILQRALRFNPESKKLWTEYFRMELLCIDQLMKRREVLGMQEIQEEETVEERTLLNGQVAEIVYNKAIETFPDDVEFHLSFLPVCSSFTFTEKLQDDMINKLWKNHPKNELVWNAVARRHLVMANQVKPVLNQTRQERENIILHHEADCWKVYEDAVKQLSTEQMWTFYLKSCLQQLDMKASKKLSKQRLEKTLAVFASAANFDKISSEMYLEWVEVLMNTGQIEQVKAVCEMSIKRYPTLVPIWLRYLQIAMQLNTLQQDEIMAEIQKCLQLVSPEESHSIWKLSLDWASVNAPHFIEPLLEKGVLGWRDVAILAKETYLDWYAVSKNIHKVREVYQRFSSTKPLSVNYFMKYLAIENSQPNVNLKKCRSAFEDAIREYGNTDCDLWIEFIQLELSHPKGQPQNVGTLHWRAMKALDEDNVEDFITKYTLLQSGHLK